MREFVDPYDVRLNLISREVAVSELSSPEIISVFDDMRSIAGGKRDAEHPSRPTLVGLSAPQIGQMLRIIIVDVDADPNAPNFTPNLKIFVNPRVIEASTNESAMREGCFSTGQICGAVIRPDEVLVTALDENGTEFEFRSTNTFQSHILQHEIDHLDGIRFPSRIRKPEHLHTVGSEDFQNYRENWKTWDKLCSFGDWLKMYNGEKA